MTIMYKGSCKHFPSHPSPNSGTNLPGCLASSIQKASSTQAAEVQLTIVDFPGYPPNEPTMVDSGVDITNQSNAVRFAATKSNREGFRP